MCRLQIVVEKRVYLNLVLITMKKYMKGYFPSPIRCRLLRKKAMFVYNSASHFLASQKGKKGLYCSQYFMIDDLDPKA